MKSIVKLLCRRVMSSRFPVLVPLSVVALLGCSNAELLAKEAAPISSERAARIDAIFAEWNQPTGPGCALAVVKEGRIDYERGYGMANLDYNLPIAPDTVFYIASVSKQFTAASIALLAEEGRISLDDDIRKYVPEIPAYDKPILIRHLVHHTSGLLDYISQWYAAGRTFADSIGEKELIAHIAAQDRLDFSPGSQYKYSNSGYFLMGVIVARASGKTLREYADEKIFKPLGMHSTRYRDDRTLIVPRRATAYQYKAREGGGDLGAYQSSFDLVGDGGVLSTVHDLYLWDQNFYRNKLGSRGQAFIDQLLSTEPLSDGKSNGYAFGLQTADYRGMQATWHGGAFLGYKADLIRLPQQRLSAILLCNAGMIVPGPLTRKVLDVYLDQGAAK